MRARARRCAEAAAKCPGTLEMPELATIIRAAHQSPTQNPLRARVEEALKTLASIPFVRGAVLACARGAEGVPHAAAILPFLYRVALSAQFVAGVRDGLRRFRQTEVEHRLDSQNR